MIDIKIFTKFFLLISLQILQKEYTTKRIHIQITKQTINKTITLGVIDHSSKYISLDST